MAAVKKLQNTPKKARPAIRQVKAIKPERALKDVSRLLEYVPMLTKIESDEQRDAALKLYRELRDTHDAFQNTESPKRLLASLLAKSLAEYGQKTHPPKPVPGGKPAAVLATLMDQYGLKQSELPIVGSQSVVSDLINGKREFNTRHIKALVERFRVPAELFLA